MKTCTICGEEKSLKDFARRTKAKDGYKNKCKKCYNEWSRVRYKELWSISKRKKWNEDAEYREERLRWHREYNKTPQRREYSSRYNQNSGYKLRSEFLEVYGHACACCGEPREEFLSLDHVFGGGNKDRKARGRLAIYKDALRDGAPHPEFRILCHNCNQAFGYYGYCPHSLEDKESIS